MKRFLRWAVGILLALLLLAGVLILARDPILRRLEERSILESTGLRAEIGEFHSSLTRARFTIRNLKLYNLPEFGGTLLADIPELSLDLDAHQLAQGILHFRDLTLNLALLHVVKNPNGRYNLEGVDKAVREHLERRRKRTKREKLDLDFGGIDRLQLTLRQVRFTDFKRPNRSRDLDLAIKNEVTTSLKTDEDLQNWIGGLVFRILVQQSLGNLSAESFRSSVTPEPPPAAATNSPTNSLPPTSP